jgi:DNA-binding NarL/FixJ family response regulator
MKRILIVDDNDYVRDVVRTFLKDAAGIEVCGEAIDGREAIEKATLLKADVVLLDLAMPSMNGVEAASILKKNLPGLRIIMFTMYSENIPKSTMSSIGVDAVLSKPDGMAHLVESINRVMALPNSSHTPQYPA